MADLSANFKMVEDCIKNLGIDPVTARGKKEGQWSLVKGSAKVWIDLWHIEKENRAYCQVMSPVMKVPTANMEAFYKELLETNDKLFGVGFTMYNNWIWLKVIREVDGMDQSEAAAMIHRIGNYADKYDDYFINKYGSGSPDIAGGPSTPGGPAPTS